MIFSALAAATSSAMSSFISGTVASITVYSIMKTGKKQSTINLNFH